MNHVFTTDGSYALSMGSIVVPTQHFTEPMWKAIEDTAPELRIPLVMHFNVGVHDYTTKQVCKVCHLSATDVPLQQWIQTDNKEEE